MNEMQTIDPGKEGKNPTTYLSHCPIQYTFDPVTEDKSYSLNKLTSKLRTRMSL